MRNIAYSKWLGLVIACFMFDIAIAIGQTSSRSTEQVSPAASATWRFQRLLVPTDHPEDWPRDASEHYLPMSVDEFEQRIAQLRRGVATPATPSETQLIRANYTAELAGDKTLVGKMEWTFEHHGSAPDTLALGNCQISLTDLSWFNDASSGGENRSRDGGNAERALVGNDENGRLAAVVDRAGTMHGRWSLSGQKDAGGALSFDLQLPVSGLNQLQLTLPTDLKPSIDSAIVSSIDSPKENQRTWQIELGGKRRATLRIVKQSAPPETTVKTFVRESFRYEYSPHGLELTAEFRLDVTNTPLRQMTLEVDRPLSVVKARIGETDVAMMVVDSKDEGHSDVQNLELELPEPIQASGVVLQLTAIAPIAYGTSFRLPLVQVTNSDWQTGEARLIVPSSLVLDDLVTENSRQISAESLSEPVSGEAIHLAFFQAHPGIELTLSRRSEKLRVRQGTSIFLRANEGSGRYIGEFEVNNGELFALEAEIAPQWIIEEVESTPPGMVADWSQHLVRSAAGKLSVQLGSPLTTQHKIRLSITGRRRTAPWGETMHADDLAILKFAGAAVTRRLIQAQTTETYQLQLRGAEQLTRLDPTHLSTADTELLDEKPLGLVFADDKHAQNLAVSITGKAPQYNADIQSEALVENDRLTESYRFSIKPQGREVARFNVRFSQLRNTPTNWSIEGEPGATVTARRLTENEGSVVSWPGDVWEVALSSPRATPFVLLASRSTTLSDDMPLALASLLEAEIQQGTIEITSVADRLPEIRSRRLKAIPIDPSAVDQYPTAVAAFRYDPDEDALLTAEPPLVLAPHGSGVALARAWIWQAQLESHFSRSGVENMLTCRVENAGEAQLQFQVPTGAELQSALIDRQRTTDLGAGNGSWKFNLPRGERFCTVVLCWNNQQHPVQGIVASCLASWPVTDVPILSRQWTVWIPPNAAIADVQIANSHMLDAPWSKRLFGLLAPGPNNSVEKFLVAYDGSQSQGKSNQAADSGKAPVKTDIDDKRATAPAAGLQSPWKSVPDDQWSDSENWKCYHFDGSGATDCLWIADKQLFWSWSWSLFVVTIALRWRIGNGRPALNIGVIGIATVVALLVPAPWAPLSAAVWLGIVGGQLMTWISLRTRIRNSMATSLDDSAATVAGMATAISLVVVAALLAGQGFAKADEAESSSERTVGPPSGSRVLVPIDHDGQPTGGFYYVPEAFRDELLRATIGEFSPPQYLVIRATYRPRPGQNSRTGELISGDWEAEYVIESLVDHAELKLPFGFDGAALIPNGVKLDGEPATFGSDDQKQNLLVTLSRRGTHRLVVLLHPAANSDGISFAIPRIADSQLDLREIDTSKYKAEIHSASDVTESRRNKSENQVVGSNLLDRIEIRSSELAVPIKTSPAFDIDELYWLRIRRNSVVVDARFHLNVHAGSVRQLYLHADRRWRPVSPQENGSTSDAIAVSQTHPLPGDSNVWVIDLAQPATGLATVDVEFRMDTESGIGRWQPSLWEVAGAHTAQRWWAATVDRELEFALSPLDSDPTISPEKFASMWQSRNELPQIAWRSKPAESSRSIAAWPRKSKLVVQYQLAAIAGRKELELRLAAHVKVVDGPVFQYRLRIPPNMEIETLSVREQGVAQPTHWSRSRSDLATVLLDSPVRKESDLLVVGRVPLTPEANFTLPQMNMEESVAEGFRTLIFRRDEVLLQVPDFSGLQSLPESDFAAATTNAEHEGLLEPIATNAKDGRQPEQLQLVSVLNGHDFQPAILHIEPNHPRIRALQVAALSRSADAWLATLHLDLQINSGVLDALRFDLPANWIGPFEISPALPYSVEEITGENRRQLVVRPESPFQDNVRLKISGPLTIASGQRASAPDVRLIGEMRQTRFFLLPRRLENQQLAWETRGLVPRPLAEAITSIVPDPSSYRAYQLVGDHCRAELRSIERGTENAQVRLVDVDWSWDPSGNHWGVAAFDLDPAGGATSCELQLPATEFLVQVELDSAPAQLSPEGENRWTVWLGDNKLPRHLEVIFAGDHLVISGNSLTLTAPALVDLPVERTLWNVRSPDEAGAGTLPGGKSISPLKLQQLRLECAATSIDSANSLLLDESISDVARWYTLWMRRFAACRADLVMAKSAKPADELSQSADTELKAIDQDQAKLARKLDGANQESEALFNKPLIASDWLHMATFVESPPCRTTLAMLRGDGNPLTLLYARQCIASQQWRYIMAAAVGVLTIGLLLVLRFTKPAQTKFFFNSQY